MKVENKYLIFLASSFFVLVACGDDAPSKQVTDNYVPGYSLVSSKKDLPECNVENEGAQYFVNKDEIAYICLDGDWNAESITSEDLHLDCKAESLKSGYKVVCNGDSVGFFQNGSDGTDGADGKKGTAGVDCSVKKNDGGSATIVCGKDTLTYRLFGEKEEDVISDVKVSGFSQKGPFVKGAKVIAYELNNGVALQQTSRKFVGLIQSDDGKFVIPSVSLVSPYIILEANGFYRNEVSGQKTISTISLFALTDLMEREKVNINLLTHLEYYRVRSLVIDKKMDFYKARNQAEKEIFDAFHIDNNDFESPEDLDIFSAGDDNAALLAISILLQRDGSEAELTNVMDKVSSDIAKDGKWDDKDLRLEIAKWAMEADESGRFEEFRENVENWGLGDTVPNFEKYLRQFWKKEIGLKECGSESAPLGSLYLTPIANFKCDEKETAVWMHANSIDVFLGEACTSLNDGDVKKSEFNSTEWLCENGEWTYVMKLYDGDDIVDARDNRIYKTVSIGTQQWMAENLSLDVCSVKDSCIYFEDFGRVYNWSSAIDSMGLYSQNSAGCGNGVFCNAPKPVRGICPEGWHIPSKDELFVFLDFVGKYNGRDLVDMVTEGESNKYGFTMKVFPAEYDEIYGKSSYAEGYNRPSFWTSDEIDYEVKTDRQWEVYVFNMYDYYSNPVATWARENKKAYAVVRCLKDGGL